MVYAHPADIEGKGRPRCRGPEDVYKPISQHSAMSTSNTPPDIYRQPGSQLPLAQTQDLPCVDCRRRKVRCSKTEPCMNCQRFGVECVYEEQTRLVSRRTPSTNDQLVRRVAELEELVRNISRQPQRGRSHFSAPGGAQWLIDSIDTRQSHGHHD
jgi:hypothetical protein